MGTSVNDFLASASPDDPKKPKSFYAHLLSVPAFPFKQNGWATILAGAVVFGLVDLITRLPFGGIFAVGLVFLGSGFLAAYMIKIIGASAGGDEAPPDWPDITNAWDDIAKPCFLVVGTVVFCCIPLIVLAVRQGYEEAVQSDLRWVCLVSGLIYLPMGFIAVALYESLGALNPWLIFRAIVKTLPAYLVATVGFFLAIFLSGLIQAMVADHVPIAGMLLAAGVGLYFMMVEMHLLGLLYRTHAKRLGWFT